VCYPWAVWVVQNHPRSFFCRVWSQLSKNSRRRPETARPLATSLPALRREGCFFSVLLSFCTKGLTVRVNRLDCETAIFFDGVHLLPRR
jgi:hypothetical protein